ncbi:NADPH:quinone oxidoreductase family protein [Phaeobacter inhibens]|uniref:NADPH:quinone oxidoreductase family protein n=1 Tax=Phaeobacter inhibens TaxID=221822 RepID=UPI0021A61B3F|nr:NADPH:quinone oxidoreductase family protein [Phaeobacter inhibens]UWR55814.1 NADPH:quinone oxidoreductase family protein [Phaeobacter inhibens]
MRAYRVSSFDISPTIVKVDVRSPKSGEVAVAIHACGLNFADLLLLRGKYQDTPDLPFVPGLELAGVIEAVGADVDGLAVGDRVAVFSGQGGLAETGVFPVDRVTRIPDEMSFADAAAFQITYGTGLVALDHFARLQPGETLLVTGAAGGVGLTAVEIGKRLGARVIAHARGAEKLAVAKAAGADHLINASEDLRQSVKDLGGADVVYEAIGGDVWQAAFRATNPGGRLLPIGFAGGEVPQIPANHLLVKNLSVIGFYFGGYLKSHPAVIRSAIERLLQWYRDGSLRPHISHRLPLDQVSEGLDLLRSRQATGKVVIMIRPDQR